MAMVFVQTHSVVLLYFVLFHLLYANNTTTTAISPTSSPTPSPTQHVLFTLDQDMALLFLSLFIVLIAGICCCGSVMVIFAFFSFRLKRHEKLFSHQLYEEALSDGSNKSGSLKKINIKILDPTKKSTSISNEKSQSYEQQLKDKKQELSVQSQSSNADNDQDKEQKKHKKHKKDKKDKKDKDRRRDHHKKDRKKDKHKYDKPDDHNRNRKKDNKKHHKKSHKKVQKIDKNENKDSSGPSPSPNPNNIGNKNDKDDIMSQNTITTSAKAPSMVENINPFYHQQQQQQIQLQTINNNQIHKSTTSMLSTQISNTGISLNRIPTNASNDSIVDHDHDHDTGTNTTTSIHNIDIMSTSTHTTDLNSSSATTTDDGSSQPIFKLPKKVTKGHWM